MKKVVFFDFRNFYFFLLKYSALERNGVLILSKFLTETVQKLLFDQKLVQYELKSVEVEIRTIEISSLLCGIHRGRLDNVMKDHISKLLPKQMFKKIFSKILKNFGKYFHF